MIYNFFLDSVHYESVKSHYFTTSSAVFFPDCLLNLNISLPHG